MEVEILEARKEDTEKEIKELNSITNNLLLLEFGTAEFLKKDFIKRINSEIEWKELILSELDSSINFKTYGYHYPPEVEDMNEDLIKGISPKDLK